MTIQKPAPRRNYSLVGPEAKSAVDKGLVGAEWYLTDVSRARMKELTKRANGPAIRDTLIWFGAMAGLGVLGGILWGGWLAVPFLLGYGILYGSAADSRWHECGHGTAFRTRWMNEAIYHVASFMMMREPTVYRWSHFKHHTDTLIVGQDPEIQAMRPPRLAKIILNLIGLEEVPVAIYHMGLHSIGLMTAEERTYVPEVEHPKVARMSRLWLTLYGVTIAACLVTGSILPAIYIGLPRLYGCSLQVIFGLTQHAGLGEDVLDHRLNSRTVYLNPVFRFIYWNMNYHVAHHMFPLVPYHRLPELHKETLRDIPAPLDGLLATYRQIIPTILRQLTDPTYFVWQALPPSARPHPERATLTAMAARTTSGRDRTPLAQ